MFKKHAAGTAKAQHEISVRMTPNTLNVSLTFGPDEHLDRASPGASP
jgi:hypothetical protein